MTRARSAILLFLTLAAPIFGASSALSQPTRLAKAAQPKAAAKQALATRRGLAPLTFNVTARISAPGISKGPAQTIDAAVALSGTKARVQTIAGGQPVVILYAPPYVYRILPKAKAGVRWQLKSPDQSSMSAFDPQQLLRDPTQIRASLLRGGAKKMGAGMLKGIPSEIYEIKPTAQRVQGLKVWLRRADALPLRLEAKGQGFQIVATWSFYARPQSLSPVLFTPPASYHIRDVRSAPPLSGL